MATTPLSSSFYADPQTVSSLRLDAKTQGNQALRETARQFESLFTSMMLKSMRAATVKDSLFNSDQTDFYQDMFDQQLATQLSQGKGLGLADMLVNQLMRSGAVPATSQQGASATAGVATGAAGTTGAAASGTAAAWPPATKEAFVQALLPSATAAGQQLGVDPQALIAQAALETNWGRSMPRTAEGGCSFNLFGIKAGSNWTGATADAATTEVLDGKAQRQTASFRSYDSPEACMADYARLLSASPRYSAALGSGSDLAGFAGALQRGGYATDPDYASKLATLAQQLKSRTAVPISVSDFT